MSADTLVFDMSSQSEGSPSVFVRKDWLSILDNQNQNYQGNQSVVDTSQLANSNKYMNYREGYFLIPLMLTLTGGAVTGTSYFSPASTLSSADFALGLKNWYGSIIHSFTLDYNGTTIIQQTPYIGMWNTFKLVNSLSFNDLVTSASQLGFYPDTASSWAYCSTAGASGTGTCNNLNGWAPIQVANQFNEQDAFNEGLLKRQLAWNFDPQALTGPENSALTFSTLFPASSLNQMWKSYIYTKVNQTATSNTGTFQVAISSIVYLKHLASFFERVPLLKGVFMKMTLNLNQSSVNFSVTSTQTAATLTSGSISTAGVLTAVIATGQITPSTGQYIVSSSINYYIGEQLSATTWEILDPPPSPITLSGPSLNVIDNGLQPLLAFTSVVPSSPLGGVQPIMLASAQIQTNPASLSSGGSNAYAPGNYIVSLAVGNKVLNTSQSSSLGIVGSPLSGSIILNIPAYTFNPVFESSYLSSPIKKIVYTDVYQYQIVNTIGSKANFNNLISNGIANIKSVLCLPFFSSTQSQDNLGYSPIQSPFDPAGAGPTSPLCLITQFNVQISGQNAIYNTERYAYEQYLNQLYGQMAVNGGQTDGMTSGLIDQRAFESSYCYYYVNCGRMLPVEEAVPKSVSILGQSQNVNPIDLFIFVEYGVEVSLDILTGARV
jgi:hypothetical protein